VLCVQIAHTTRYGPVLPAYSQPMMSDSQMPHDDMASQPSVGGHTETYSEQFLGAIVTDFNAGQNYSTDGSVPVPATADTHCPVDENLNEEILSVTLVRCCSFLCDVISLSMQGPGVRNVYQLNC